jgi:hypothetical protein
MLYNKLRALPGLLLVHIVLLSLLLWSCNHSSPALHTENDPHKDITQTVSLSSFSMTDKANLHFTGQNGFFSTLAVVDTFLLCTDYRLPTVLHVFSTTSYALLGNMVTRGDQKGQVLSIANILPASQKNNCWLYDITSGKLLRLDISKAIRDSAYRGEEEIILNEATKRAKSPCRINDSLFAACSYTTDQYRFFTFNSQSTIINKTGNLPARHEDWPDENKESKFNILASIYTANMVKHPEKDLFMVAYNKTDRLELYEKGALKKVTRGPDVFDPVITFGKEENIITVNETEETLYSYTSLCATSKYVYALYSGKGDYNTCSKKLLVFDWEGNPVKTIETDKSICFFTVRETVAATMLYAVEADTGNLYTSKL